MSEIRQILVTGCADCPVKRKRQPTRGKTNSVWRCNRTGTHIPNRWITYDGSKEEENFLDDCHLEILKETPTQKD